MKKIITMVGTSIFENYLKEGRNSNISVYLEPLRNKRAKDLEKEKERSKRIREIINSWANKKVNRIPEDISAEIKSLVKLKKELKDDFEIYLLCSDTILSNLAGEIIKETLHKSQNFRNSRIELETIVNLQIWNRKDFYSGMTNLIYQIYRIAGENWFDVIINITGGYKATIPYLTILAQINNCPMYYIFEETNSLIEIPYIPIDIKWKVFEDNEEFFFMIEKEGIREIDERHRINRDIMSLLEFVDNMYCLNPLGVALWQRYKSNYEYFHISRLVEEYLKRKLDRKTIFEKSVLELSRRLKENPSHPDLNHFLKNADLPEGFRTFKHRQENLQVRVLYSKKEQFLYVGLIAIGNDVHNVENEYVELFKREVEKVKNLSEYELVKIKKE